MPTEADYLDIMTERLALIFDLFQDVPPEYQKMMLDKLNNTVRSYKMKIYPITSPRSDRPAANQFEIHTDDGVYFQSYQSIIAFVPHNQDKKTQLDKKYWDYSVTTSKYRNLFLGLNSKEIKARIDSGVFKLVNLN